MNNVRAADDLKFPVKDVRSVVEGVKIFNYTYLLSINKFIK